MRKVTRMTLYVIGIVMIIGAMVIDLTRGESQENKNVKAINDVNTEVQGIKKIQDAQTTVFKDIAANMLVIAETLKTTVEKANTAETLAHQANITAARKSEAPPQHVNVTFSPIQLDINQHPHLPAEYGPQKNPPHGSNGTGTSKPLLEKAGIVQPHSVKN